MIGLNGFVRILTDFAGDLKGRETEPLAHGLIPDDHVIDPDHKASPFKVDKGYLRIRLSEMRLSVTKAWLETVTPMCVVVVECPYDGELRSFAMTVGKDTLHNLLQKTPVGGAPIELMHTSILGPVPLSGPDISVFVGLFAVRTTDQLDALLEVFGEFADSAALGASLGAYLPLASAVRSGVAKLMQAPSTECRFALRYEFSANGGAAALKQMYIVCSNAPAKQWPMQRMWVKDKRLAIGDTAESLVSPTNFDHCLLSVSNEVTRPHFSDLPFDKLWVEIKDMIWKGQDLPAIQREWPNLARSVMMSPDLIPDDKSLILASYRTQLQAVLDLYRQQSSFTPAPSRGGRAPGTNGNMDLIAPGRLKDLAGTSNSPLAKTLLTVAKFSEAKDKPKGRNASSDIDAKLASLRSALGKQRPSPKDLYEAFMNELTY